MNHEPLDRLHLKQIAAAYAAGYRMARAELNEIKQSKCLPKYYSLSQCYRTFGRGDVDRWAAEGLIEIIKDGPHNSKCRILAEQIELIASQKDKKYYSLTECYEKFGRGTVDRWADEGLIEIIKYGIRKSKCRILSADIELVASQSNRASWFDNHE